MTELETKLLGALKDIADDYADRFDLDSESTNPGIKIVIQQAREAISAAEAAQPVEDRLREAAKDFYNRTVADKDVVIRCNSAEKRDAITVSGERLRDILTQHPKGIKND